MRSVLPWVIAASCAAAPVPAAERLPLESQTHPVVLERVGSEHGLSHNSVFAIVQDAQGFLWLGTQDGLNRYDGVEFTVYKHDPADPQSLRSSWITALVEDRTGRLWVGTRRGLQWTTGDGRFTAFDGAPPPRQSMDEVNVTALCEDADGVLWVGSEQGVLRIDADRTTAQWLDHRPGDAHSLAGAVVSAITLASDGTPWVLTQSAPDVSVVQSLARPTVRHEVPHALALHMTGADEFWIDTRGPSPAASRLGASAFAVDHGGRVWVGTYEGLFIRHTAAGPLERVDTLSFGKGVLTSEITTILPDQAGAVWIGTFGGVLRFDPRRSIIRHVQHQPGDPASLASDAVSAVYRDSSGRVWVGTYGTGLDAFDPVSGIVNHYRHDARDARTLCGDYVWDLARSRRGGFWVAASQGLCRLHPPSSFQQHPLPPGTNPLRVLEAEDGRLWLGTDAGLSVYDPDRRRTRAVRGGADGVPDWIDSLLEGLDGTLWVGSSRSGWLVGLDPQTARVTRRIRATHEAIWDIRSAADGTMWLATNHGPVRVDPVTDRAAPLVPDDPQARAVYYSVVPEPDGSAWFGTSSGLVHYAPSDEARRFRRYDLADGSGSLEFNRHAAFRAADGTLLFGGMNGLTLFRPGDIRRNDAVPPIVIRRVQTVSHTGERWLSARDLDAVTLEASDYMVTFEFAALNFTRGHKNEYAYRLDGLDREWIPAGSSRTARYTSLPPGTYTFRVKGANNDGVWNEEGASLRLLVRPALWQTPAFRGAAVALVVLLAALAYRLRIRRLTTLHQMRLRIAGDLHDELGSDLSGIALVSRRLGEKAELTERDRHRLSEVASTATHVVEGLRDIVWYIDPEQDTLASMEQRMRSVAHALLDGVAHEVEARGLDGAAIDMRVRRHVFLVYKELVHNVARHARASHVWIRLEASGDRLTLEVADNGVGVQPDGASWRASVGHGLRNIERRAAALGAAFRLDARPGGGTCARLTVMTRTRRSLRLRARVP